jgi:hypothetical protein
MTKKQIKEMILAILNQADYDLAKSYQKETAEEPETVDENMGVLVDIAEEHIKKAIEKTAKKK